MFSGIIRHTGKVMAIKLVSASKTMLQLSIPQSFSLNQFKFNDSIGVIGLCLSIEEIGDDFLWLRMTPQRLALSAGFELGNIVNLELTLKVGDSFNGYFFSGITDVTAEVIARDCLDEATKFTFLLPREYADYLVNNGLVALNGAVLTIVEVFKESQFSVTMLPHTIEWTNFRYLESGMKVNLEFDAITRLVVKQLRTRLGMSVPL